MIDKDVERAKIFLITDDSEFSSKLAAIVADAYHDLFDVHGTEAWNISRDSLITFFRQSDESTELVGQRQATTFMTVAQICGMRAQSPQLEKQLSVKPKSAGKAKANIKAPATKIDISGQGASFDHSVSGKAVSLTVRIEINLPAQADQKTYDSIFKSLKEHLMNG